MPGPKTPTDALSWIRDALRAGRYLPSGHFRARLAERKITMDDVFHAVEHATTVEPYDRAPEHRGTCWRLFGPDPDEIHEVRLGVEAFLDKKRRRVAICTVLPKTEKEGKS